MRPMVQAVAARPSYFDGDDVAKARGLSLERVSTLVGDHTEDRDLAVFGEPRVNVLLLNRALDELSPSATSK